MKRGAVYQGVVERVDFPNKGRVFIEDKGNNSGVTNGIVTSSAMTVDVLASNVLTDSALADSALTDGVGINNAEINNVAVDNIITNARANTTTIVTVKNTIPGQTVEFRIKKAKKGQCQGQLLRVIKPSLLETEKKVCRNFGSCGGCSYQTIPYEEQLKLKEDQVKRLLMQVYPKTNEIFEGILSSPLIWEYRNKMEFSFGDEYKDGPLALGLHKRGSIYDILNADDCKLVHSDYNQILSCTLEHFSKRKISYYHKDHKGVLRHLLVRRAAYTGELLISLVTSGQYKEYEEDEMGLEEWKEKLLALPLEGKPAGILHIVNDSPADIVKCDKMNVLYGRDYFYDKILGLKFKISTFSFFQTNTKGAEVLYSLVRKYVGNAKEKVVFDLYSGTGTIAQLMASVAKKVIGVELVEEAVEAAKENATENGLDNCEFIAGDVLDVMDRIEEKPDLIILDPPRDGIHPKALKKICRYGVERMVYVSCKPTSLARDLKVLLDMGYCPERICCVGQFPQTEHVETVVLIQRKDT